jgi:hypothetical protein
VDGAAVMDAHVDSALLADYRGAFHYLGLTKPGMRVDVVRADHSEAVFTIDEAAHGYLGNTIVSAHLTAGLPGRRTPAE